MSTEWHDLPDGRQRLRSDGVIEMRHSATTQTLESVKVQMEHAERLLEGGPPAPMLVVLDESTGQTKEVRHYLMTDPMIARVASRVALVGRSPVSRVLTAFFVRLTRPPIPLRVFKDEDTALAWLKEGR
jgi:hypothetical protein